MHKAPVEVSLMLVVYKKGFLISQQLKNYGLDLKIADVATLVQKFLSICQPQTLQ